MGMHLFEQFVRDVEAVASPADLVVAMKAMTHGLGFEYFALAHHVDILKTSGAAIWLHNYPAEWADFYDANALGVSDPVHRASHLTSFGFRWSHMVDMIPLTAFDRRMLDLGRKQGIGEGFTVPANIPGEALGSCSFANGADRLVPEAVLPLAHYAGALAFESARRLCSIRHLNREEGAPAMTDRQRDCILWAARGKGDWEIGRILGVSEETVARHVKQACDRYGVHKRTSLVIRALFDGTLTFTDIFKR